MKRLLINLILTIALLSVENLHAKELASPYLDQSEAPNPAIFDSVLKCFEAFRDQLPYKNEGKIKTNIEKGTIETNWLSEHKGEVKLIIQIALCGSAYRVYVWQETGFLQAPFKTAWSMRLERHLQNEIEKHNH